MAQAAGNSFTYLENVSAGLEEQGRLNPAPYDIFALHPYPSDEYRHEDGRVVVDPRIYLRWPEDEPPKPTTIHKFLNIMADEHGRGNQPLWITELGWNRAKESTNPVTRRCPAVTTTWVDRYRQASYALDGFDILFKETAWDAQTPSVDKIFWYQYVDVGIPESSCYQVAGANTPSWPTSFLVQGASLAEPQGNDADWWFGLYGGIDWSRGGAMEPNSLVHCVFSKYPSQECLIYPIFLPLIQK